MPWSESFDWRTTSASSKPIAGFGDDLSGKQHGVVGVLEAFPRIPCTLKPRVRVPRSVRQAVPLCMVLRVLTPGHFRPPLGCKQYRWAWYSEYSHRATSVRRWGASSTGGHGAHVVARCTHVAAGTGGAVSLCNDFMQEAARGAALHYKRMLYVIITAVRMRRLRECVTGISIFLYRCGRTRRLPFTTASRSA